MGSDSASLIFEKGEWIVVLKENGTELRRLFVFEQHARSWYDGQRIRMRLPMNDNSATAH